MPTGLQCAAERVSGALTLACRYTRTVTALSDGSTTGALRLRTTIGRRWDASMVEMQPMPLRLSAPLVLPCLRLPAPPVASGQRSLFRI